MLIFWVLSAWAAPDLSRALNQSTLFEVRYSAGLGEGKGHFDSMPRSVDGTVNCMTWLQWVLASAYAADESQQARYLQDIRYYDSVVSFGTRKHYIDRWVALDPTPLVPLNNERCRPDVLGYVTLETDLFKEKHGYTCPLYEDSQRQFPVESLTRGKMTDCLKALPEGYYVLFFVGSDLYMERWGKYGKMGQVHSMIVQKAEEVTVYHASVDKQRVVTETWPQLSERLESVALGYTIYGLTDSWPSPRSPSQQSLTIAACEQAAMQKP